MDVNKLSDYHRLRAEEEKTWARSAALPASHEEAALAALCESYLAASPAHRALLRSQVDRATGSALQGFSMAMAVAALRERSEHRILLGLTAHALETLVCGDVRDNLVLITLLFHAARQIGSDPAIVFRRMAAISGPAIAAIQLDYLERPPETQKPECMGYRLVETPEGPDFSPCATISSWTK